MPVDGPPWVPSVFLRVPGSEMLRNLFCPVTPGNHETDNMNQIYGFEGEVKAKYTAQMYELFSEVFEWLPLAQCINGKVLVRTPRGPRPTTGRSETGTCW